MENKNILIGVGILALVLICLCGIFASAALSVSALSLASARSPLATTELPDVGAATPGGFATQTRTPAITASPVHVLTPTGVISATHTQAPAATPLIPTLEASATSPAPSPTAFAIASDAWCVPWNTGSTSVVVHRVVDGVTFEATIKGKLEKVRYIGIDMPDFSTDASLWGKATGKNQELVEGKTVLLIEDKSNADEEGRLLRYVFVGGKFVNFELVKEGYAVASSHPPDISCDRSFQEAQELAISAGRGIWAPTPTPTRAVPTPTGTPGSTGYIIIVGVFSEGDRFRFEPDEYVEIRNVDSQPIQLEGWTLRDNKNHVFNFPNYVLKTGYYCRIYTNEYHPGTCGFSYFNPSPIWDNDGDCAYLKDSRGSLVDVFCYD